MHLTNYKNFLNTQCANCSIFLTSENIKWTNIKPENCANSSSSDSTEVSNTEAITYIYGVSKRYLIEKLKSFYIELNNDCSISDLGESSDDTVLVLCENCISVFEELYKVSKRFRNLSDRNSLIWKILEDKGFEVNIEDTDVDFDIKDEDEDPNDNSNEDWTFENWDEEDVNDEDVKPDAENVIDDNNCDDSENDDKDQRIETIAANRKSKVSDLLTIEPSNIITRLRTRKCQSSKIIDRVETLSDNKIEGSKTRKRKPLEIQYPYPINMTDHYEKIFWQAKSSSSKETKYKYKCKECGQIILSRCQFQHHYFGNHFKGTSMEKITGPPYKCPKCKTNFKQFFEILRHCAREHNLKVYKKDEELKTFFQSRLCGSSFDGHQDLAEHQRQQHSDDHIQVEGATNRKGGPGIKYPNNTNLKDHYEKIVCQEKSTSTNVKYKYKCKDCGSEFGPISQFHIHYLSLHFKGSSTHPKKISGPPYECPKCETSYKEFRGLLRHCAHLHDLKVYKKGAFKESEYYLQCKLCHETFTGSKGLTQHQRQKHQNDNKKVDEDLEICFQCNECGISFDDPEVLTEHQLQKHQNVSDTQTMGTGEQTVEMADDELADSTFESVEEKYKPAEDEEIESESRKDYLLDKGVSQIASEVSRLNDEEYPTNNKVKGSKTRKRNPLDIQYPNHISMTDHYEKVLWQAKSSTSRTVKYKYKCKECGQVILSRVQFQRHYFNEHFIESSTHPDKIPGPPYQCPKCERSFKDFAGVLAHCAIFHHLKVDKLMKLYKCTFCGENFESFLEMSKHRSSHPKEERIYKCPKCPRTFTTYEKRRYHHESCHLDSVHLCDTCGKGIKGAKAYRYHCRQHDERKSGVRPICEICGKSFVTKKMLVKHKYIMHDRREQKTCHLCGHVSATGYNLRLHLKVHEKNGILKRRKNTQASS